MVDRYDQFVKDTLAEAGLSSSDEKEADGSFRVPWKGATASVCKGRQFLPLAETINVSP